MDTTQVVAFSFGAVLILLLLWMVRTRPNPTAAEYTFMRIVLALACASAAVIVSGFIEIQIKGFIQAGGALAVFVIVFFYKPAALQGSGAWRDVRRMWPARDIHDNPQDANQDDVALALNAIITTARIIGDEEALFQPFQADFSRDYCQLYRKLCQNRYPIPQAGGTSEALLTRAAHALAQRLGCQP